MTYELPNDMDKLVYFSRRRNSEGGLMIMWVPKQPCTKCGKGIMEKPKDPKTGKPKIRATEVICNKCGYTLPKKEYEETLEAFADYDCPHCKKHGQAKEKYKWKTKQGVKTVRFACEHCGGNIDFTKKMKEAKSKAKK